MSEYTSFVAVDSERIANPQGAPARIDVPVEQMQGGVSLAGTTSVGRDFAQVVEASATAAPMEMMESHSSDAVFRLESGSRSARRDPPPPSQVARTKLKRRVRQHRRRIRKCLEGDPDPARTLRAVVKVRPNGTIASITFDGSSPDDDVERCLEREVGRWRVSRPGAETLTIEVLLDPGG
jgi:hypothetical protein